METTQRPAYENMMLPPPWRVHVGGGYINDITQEIIDVHPLKRAADMQQRVSQKLDDVVAAEPEDPEMRSRHEEVVFLVNTKRNESFILILCLF